MLIGRVIGEVVATEKHPSHVGRGALIVQPLELDGSNRGNAVIALDAIGVHLGGATFGRGSAWQRRNGGFSRGYMLRRYGVLRTRAAARAIAVELLASLADMVISRDTAALRGRLSGWRCARHLPRHPYPPRDAIDWDLSPRTTMTLRRDVQSGRQVDTAPTERSAARV